MIKHLIHKGQASIGPTVDQNQQNSTTVVLTEALSPCNNYLKLYLCLCSCSLLTSCSWWFGSPNSVCWCMPFYTRIWWDTALVGSRAKKLCCTGW